MGSFIKHFEVIFDSHNYSLVESYQRLEKWNLSMGQRKVDS